MQLDEKTLLSKGFTLQPDGSWAKSNRPLGALEAHGPECPAVRPLVQGVQEPKSGAERLGVRITLVAFRHRLLDAHDAVAYAFKPLTDAIADTLEVDDADPRLTWEYSQLRTTGPEGVIVCISTL